MSPVEGRQDAVVIGGGVGGLAAAARLTMAGCKPLLIEADEKVGGRFSTIEKDGYKGVGSLTLGADGKWHGNAQRGNANVAEIRSKGEGLGVGPVEVQRVGAESDVLLRLGVQPGGDAGQQTAIAKLKDAFGADYDFRSVDSVGPTVSSETSWPSMSTRVERPFWPFTETAEYPVFVGSKL